MMDPRLIITTYVIGILLMATEIFIPGAIIGILGALCVGTSIYLAYGLESNTLGHVLLVVGACFVPLFVLLWLKVVGRLFAVTTSEEGFTSAKEEHKALIGKEGVALSTLRPSGKALIDGQRVDVVARGEMVEPNTRIRVVLVEGNRIVVQIVRT